MGGRPPGRREVSHLHRRRRARFRARAAQAAASSASRDGRATPTICAKRSPPPTASGVKVSQILATVNEFLAAHKRYMVVAESGDMLFGGLDVRVPHSGTYLAQGFYASMGFRGAGRAGRADRIGPAADRALRRRRLPDDRAGNFAGAALRRQSDRDRGQQRRMGHLPAGGERSARPARYTAMALCATGRGLGRRGLRGEQPGRTAQRSKLRIAAPASRSSMPRSAATISRRSR